MTNNQVQRFSHFVRKHTFSTGKDVLFTYFDLDRDELCNKLDAYRLNLNKVLRHSIVVRMCFDDWILFKEKGIEAIRKENFNIANETYAMGETHAYERRMFLNADISRVNVQHASFNYAYTVTPIQQMLFCDLRQEYHPVVHILKER